MPPWSFVIFVFLLVVPASAQGINLWNDKADKKELRKAQAELKSLEKRIRKKDIPPIEFELNKAILLPHSFKTLDILADLMLRFPRFKLFIGGHTCNLGNPEYNEWLSQKRAEAVKDYLVEVGVLGEYIQTAGFGQTKPIATNDSEEGRIRNRRVEFHIETREWDSIF